MCKDRAIYLHTELAQLCFSMILVVNNNDNIICIFLCFISIVVSDISCRIFFLHCNSVYQKYDLKCRVKGFKPMHVIDGF